MPKQLIDLERIRQADKRLARLLADHPELREPNPERQKALEEWIQHNCREEDSNGKTTDR